MPDHSAFGAELRERREAAGMSLARLAERVHYSKGYLSKIESGAKPPTAQLARLCDAAVGAGGALIRFVAVTPEADAPPEHVDDDLHSWVLGVEAGGTGFFAPGKGNAARAAFGMTFDSSLEDTDVAAVAGVFRDRFSLARRLGQVAGPALVLPGLIADTQTLRRAAVAAPEAEEGPIWLLAARFAEFAGWMTQEAGDDRMAMWWTDAAVGMAEQGGDRVLASYALVRRADIALHNDDALGTIALARRALEADGVPARVRGLAAQREAQGHALAGDYDACLGALDRSARLLDSADHSGLPLGTTNTPDVARLAVGWCLYDLGRPEQAAEILDAAIDRFAPDAHRARIRYAARAALAHGTAGELERTAELMAVVLDRIGPLGSSTIRHDLRRLARVLARWPTHPPARELRQRLVAVLRTPIANP